MKLKSVEFYQSVRLWDNSEYKSVHSGERFSVNLVDHLVLISCEGEADTVVVPTANMRHGKIGPEVQIEPFVTVDGIDLVQDGNLPKDSATIIEADGKVTAFVNISEPEQEEIKSLTKRCAKGCTYSRAMDQPYPRICRVCSNPEEPKKK